MTKNMLFLINRTYRSPRDRVCGNILEYGLLGLLIFSPLPAASVYEWSILVIQLSVLVMYGAYLLMKEKPKTNPYLGQAYHWPKVFFVGFFIILLVQVLPLPQILIRIFSPSAHNYQNLYLPGFLRRDFLSFSLVPSLTIQRGLELFAYFLLGFLVIKTVTRKYQIVRVISVLIGVGVFQALYGLFELYRSSPRILFYPKVHNLDSVTGTFVNRNHLSGYLEMIVPLAVGLIIARLDALSPGALNWRERLLRLSETGRAKNLLLGLSVVVMSIAIVFSKSRSGVFILALMFILFLGITALYPDVQPVRRKRIKIYLEILFLLVVMIILFLGIDSMFQRFSRDAMFLEGRPAFWSYTMRIFSDYPLFGTGLGTFGTLYPNIEGEGGLLALTHAHNDYLEYLSELGLVGFLPLLGAISFMIVVSFIMWRARRHPEAKGLALGGSISLFSMIIHSLTDFNLHIPANMLLFSIVLSLTMVMSFYKRNAVPAEKK